MNNTLKISKSEEWNSAGKAGAVLGGATIIFYALTQLIAKYLPVLLSSGDKLISGGGLIIGVVNFILWFAKFFGCIWLMYYFLKQFNLDNDKPSRKSLYRYGVKIAFFSAALFSGYILIDALYIFPDRINQAFDLLMSTQTLDSNTLNAFEKIKDILPQIMFWSQFIYCFLFGTVLSSILSRKIFMVNLFDASKTESE